MYVKEVTVENQVGLHARPATFFIQKANEFKSSIWVPLLLSALALVLLLLSALALALLLLSALALVPLLLVPLVQVLLLLVPLL